MMWVITTANNYGFENVHYSRMSAELTDKRHQVKKAIKQREGFSQTALRVLFSFEKIIYNRRLGVYITVIQSRTEL